MLANITDPSPQLYFSVCIAAIALSLIAPWLAVRNPRAAFFATAAMVPLVVYNFPTGQGATANGQMMSLQLFDWLKSTSVLVPTVLFSYANLKLREGGQVPTYVMRFFETVLCLNILETIVLANIAPSLNGVIYTAAAMLLAALSFGMRWQVAHGTLGFSDKPFFVCYLACIGYMIFFLNPAGSGWLSVGVLLISYVTLFHNGHLWPAYRVYSLWVYMSLTHALDLKTFFRSPPTAFIDLMNGIRNSWLNEVLLVIAVGTVVALIHARLAAWKRGRISGQPAEPGEKQALS